MNLLMMFFRMAFAMLWNERGSVTIDQWWIYRFHDQLNLTYQQERSLLENLIDPGMVHRDVGAAIDHHERLGNVIANDVVAPFGPMQVLNPPSSRRATTLQSTDATVLISDENTLRSMVNPRNGYTRMMAGALGRRADKHIIDNLVGSAMIAAVTPGSGIITYSFLALPSARRLNIGGTTAWALTDIIGMNEKLSKSGVPSGANERVMLYGPGQLRDIMVITQASSSDFTKNQIHDTGTVDRINWEGFHWIEIADAVQIDGSTVLQTMLPLNAAGTSRTCIAFHRGCLGLSIGRPVGPPTIDIRADLQSRPLQVRQAMMMSAVRVFEGGVVTNEVKEN